jgi:hypothetical protein
MVLLISNDPDNAQIINYDELVIGSDDSQIVVNSVGGAYVTLQFDNHSSAMSAIQQIKTDFVLGQTGSQFTVGDNGLDSYKYTSRIWNNVNRGI